MNVSFEIANEQDKFPVTEELTELLRRAAAETLDAEGIDFDCEFSITYTDNAGIRALNREYRNKDSATDVLSFPMFDPETEEIEALDGQPAVLGDIVISLERAAEQAELYGHSFEREVAFLCVHSVLHLLGYDHETSPLEERIMREKEEAVLKELGISREETFVTETGEE